MFSGIGVKNVRCFANDTFRFELSPLTVFCGTNSSGKSTALKVLPLLKQTQANRVISAANGGHLRLTGPQVDLGDYSSLVSGNDTSKKIEISLTLDDFIDLSAFERQLTALPRFSDTLAEIKSQRLDPGETLDFYELGAKFTFEPQVASEADEDRPSQPCKTVLREAQFVMEVNGVPLTKWYLKKSEQLSKKIGLKSAYVIFIEREFYQVFSFDKQPFKELLTKKSLVGFGCHLAGIMPMLIEARPAKSTDSEQKMMVSLPPIIQTAMEDFAAALENTHYIGPLRAPAKRYYVANMDATPELDSTGEFLPYILRDRLDSKVRCCLPKELQAIESVPLGQALNEWVYYLRTGETKVPPCSEVAPVFHKSVFGEISIQGLKSLHGLIDSGFGYSQLLPVLVRGLVTGVGGTLLVEQPELHLHPSVQIRMADFLLSIARAGKQVIVETHSEHLVNALRVRVAEDEEEDGLHDIIRIHYLGNGPENALVVHDLSVQEDGTVPAWPREFFGEALELSSRLLKAQKKRRIKAQERKVSE